MNFNALAALPRLRLSVLGFGACAVLMTVGFQAPAAATTYNYVGNPYASNSFPGPAGLGSNLTGSVTFNFDTSSFTGSLFSADVSSFSLTSGSLSIAAPPPNTQFFLNNGHIKSWLAIMPTPPFVTEWQFGTTGGTAFGTGSLPDEEDFVLSFVAGEYTGQGAFLFCRPDNGCSPVDWTEAAVATTPLPTTWSMLLTGLGALGLLGWHRRRTNAATHAA